MQEQQPITETNGESASGYYAPSGVKRIGGREEMIYRGVDY